MPQVKQKILFVCLGNICRSPLAEAIFKNKVNLLSLQDYFHADSCGTANYHIGDSPDPRTIANAKSNGVIIAHTGRQLHADDLDFYDIILAMDENNLKNIHKLENAQRNSHKVKLMRAYDDQANDLSVPDPYYGTADDFQQVFEILDRSINNLIKSLKPIA